MNIEELREYCLSKPHVEESLPFGPDTLVFKVAGKVFLLTGLDNISALRFNVKCDPEQAVSLREEHPHSVFPGYHMNKKHWNTIEANGELSEAALRRWIDHSYDLILQSLPRRIRDDLKI
jgi:predicted DNA-binding protein (MmcQ/YjbR family)